MIMKLIANGFKYPVNIEEDKNYYYLSFGFNRALMEEIKTRMKGAKWMGHESPPRKVWRINKCDRNEFQFAYLRGENPQKHYDQSTDIEMTFERPLYEHQRDLVANGLVYKRDIWAAEPGTGKTLAAIEVMERVYKQGITRQWYIGPKGALPGVKLEFRIWKSKVDPVWFTYDELKISLKNWTPGIKPPQLVIIDEGQKIKNESTQRSQAVTYLCEQMRKEYGDNCYIIIMTGTPAPKSPGDWYNLAETGCPGFLKEGDIYKFKNRLAVVAQVNDVTGGRYPKLIAWRDGNKQLCNTCGKLANEDEHEDAMLEEYHKFVPMVDEVSMLYKRMKGLVITKLKSECLELPEKIYKVINIEPSPEIKRAAALIRAGSPNTITALTLLRELSDGFQYSKEVVGYDTCETCRGEKTILNDGEKIGCPFCNATGSKKIEERKVTNVSTAKLEALKDLLEDDFEEESRIVIYAGYTQSIDLVCEFMEQNNWKVIRVDGRGWQSVLGTDPVNLLEKFQDYKKYPERIAFVGHQGSAGIGLTLTASKAIIYYSNDFNSEYRIQSENRIHRPSSRGCLIYDLVHLPTDQLVIDNLRRKRELQALSMGNLQEALEYDDGNRST